MDSRVHQCLSLFLLYFLLSSGSSVAETPPWEATQKNKMADNYETQILFSSSVSTAHLETTEAVPIVNPTTPGTTPIVNPIVSPPPPVVQSPPAAAGTTPTPPTTTTPTSSGGAWCVASATASPTALQVALDYACGYGGTDCAAIQQGASCYEPNTVRDHASYAFNDYYQKNPIPTSCVFGGTAQLSYADPSSGNCHYASPRTTTSISPPAMPTPTIETPTIETPTIETPTTLTPPVTTTPSSPTVYGVAEPTGLPSSAISISCSLLLLLSTTGVLGSLLAMDHL